MCLDVVRVCVCALQFMYCGCPCVAWCAVCVAEKGVSLCALVVLCAIVRFGLLVCFLRCTCALNVSLLPCLFGVLVLTSFRSCNLISCWCNTFPISVARCSCSSSSNWNAGYKPSFFQLPVPTRVVSFVCCVFVEVLPCSPSGRCHVPSCGHLGSSLGQFGENLRPHRGLNIKTKKQHTHTHRFRRKL